MKNLKPPGKTEALFDWESAGWWHTQLAPNALRRLENGWQGIFHRMILALLGALAHALGAKLDEGLGRPSKELYAMSGLLLIAEFENWTIDEAAEAWTLNAGVQYALHLPRDGQYLSARALDDYRKLLRENVDVQELFAKVTSTLVQALELDLRRQRLDSTHVLSQMAQLGRQQLLAVSVRRFLVQLKQHDASGYAGVDQALRERYAAAETRLFGFGTKKAQPRAAVLQQVAEDLAALVDHFASAEPVAAWPSYQALARLLREHCEVREDKTVVVRPQSRDAGGGSVHCLQNPSDPGAGYSGHKGPGYQVQLAQTLPPRDAAGKIEGPGLVVACVPQSAAVRDNEAVPEVLAQQRAAGLLPEQMVADTIYGSDANVRACALLGVRLLSPVPGMAPQKEAKHHCTVAERALKERLATRRAEQATAEWKKEYALRSGGEGLNRALDVTTGVKQLRVRGPRAVLVAVTLKVTGWNIRAAAQIQARRARRARAKARLAAVAGARTLRGAYFSASAGTPRLRPRRRPIRSTAAR